MSTLLRSRLHEVARLDVNFLQPSSNLRSKRRQGVRVLKWHDVPATPFSRLLAGDRVSADTKRRLQEIFDVLDPVHLLAQIRQAQQRLAALEVGRSEAKGDEKKAQDLDAFLQSLKDLWRGGEVLPMHRKRFQGPRWRTRPDPFDSNHDFEIFVNLAKRIQLTGINQLWMADITFIRLQQEFVYLAVILDAFSRKVMGWALERSLAAQLAVAALRQGITSRHPPPGLVHHSDRGIQYASSEYGKVLDQHRIAASMSRLGNPWDNAKRESFMKTLKQEEIHATVYRDLEHLRSNVAEFIERYYNTQRLHSALSYQSPDRFEQSIEPGANLPE